MIIDWTYGAYAQVQRYFGVGYWLTDSSLSYVTTVVGLRRVFSKDTLRREFIKDTESRDFVMDTARRVFKVK